MNISNESPGDKRYSVALCFVYPNGHAEIATITVFAKNRRRCRRKVNAWMDHAGVKVIRGDIVEVR